MKTPVSLLERLRQPNNPDAWARFVQLYTPLLYHWLRRQGCSADDAADLMQEVFVTLVEVMPHFVYDRHKSFRRWLRTVAINQWRDRVKRRQLPTAVANQVDDLPAPEADVFWEREYRGHLARRALEIMQADFSRPTWKACWELVVNGRSATDVAAELGLTTGAVHAARFRVLKRLRQELTGLLE